MFESKSGVFLIAGLGFFLLAFLSNGVVPWIMYANMPEKTLEQIVKEQLQRQEASKAGPNWTVVDYFQNLKEYYPESFKKHYGKEEFERKRVSLDKSVEAIRVGHKAYVAEACWHCHSQFVRPVSNEERRWGPVSQSWEYQNELQKPVLFGTRRVGPDLTREGGRRSNDWHATHFYKPRWTSPQSVMPEYSWFFDGEPGLPNERGLGLIMYMQYLGSWMDGYPTMIPEKLKVPNQGGEK